MNRQAKRLFLTIDDERYVSYKAPEGALESDLTCPACGSSQYRHKVTLVQHGFIDDNCCSIIGCDRCGAMFHYIYSIESRYAVVVAQPESESGVAGLNNIEHLGQ